MSKKNVWVSVLAVLVIAAGVYTLSRNKKANAPTNMNEQNNVNQSSENSAENVAGQLAGVLEVSDNPDKGNLMLLTPKRTLYLNTSRDYSLLLQKEVVVKIDGTETNFVILDIVAK